MSQTLDGALTQLIIYEAAELVPVWADFRTAKTLPSTAIGTYPYMTHLPYSGDVDFLTVDGDPPETPTSAPIQERVVNFKFRLLLAPADRINVDLAAVYALMIQAVDVIPTFYAKHRMVGGTCRRLQVSERSKGQRWELSNFTMLGEQHLGVEWLASITYDGDVQTGQ